MFLTKEGTTAVEEKPILQVELNLLRTGKNATKATLNRVNTFSFLFL